MMETTTLTKRLIKRFLTRARRQWRHDTRYNDTQPNDTQHYVSLSFSHSLKDTTTILKMSLLIMILLIMAIIITLNMGDITYNVTDF
jgi:hypothetical protein